MGEASCGFAKLLRAGERWRQENTSLSCMKLWEEREDKVRRRVDRHISRTKRA